MASPSKMKRRIARRKWKAARKAANTERYSTYKRPGSKKTSSNRKHLHDIQNCGNVGCLRCFPDVSERTALYFKARSAAR